MNKTEIGLILLMVFLVGLIVIWVIDKVNMTNRCINECEERNYKFESIIDEGFFNYFCSCEEKTDKVFRLEGGTE